MADSPRDISNHLDVKNENESNMTTCNEFSNILPDDATKNFEKNENVLDGTPSKIIEKTKLREITVELQEITIDLLKLKLKIVNILHEKQTDDFYRTAADIGNLELKNVQSAPNRRVDSSKPSIEQIKNEKYSEENLDKVIRETLHKLKMYRDVSFECHNFIGYMSDRKKFDPKTEYVCTNCKEFPASSSTTREHLIVYCKILTSSATALTEFETSLMLYNRRFDVEKVDDMEKKSDEYFTSRMELLIIAIENAEYAYSGIKHFIFHFLKH